MSFVFRFGLGLAMIAAAGGCLRVKLPHVTVQPGASQPEFTWRRAAELALSRNPDLQQARENLTAARHNRNQALGAYLPGVDGSVGRSRDLETTSGADDTLSLNLDVTQPLFTGFEATGEALQAWRQWEAARWAYIERSATVRQALRTAFVELLRLYQLLGVNRTIAARRQENAEMIQLRYEAGREHDGSRRRAQAIAEQAAFDLRQTERKIENQSLSLGRQLGGHFAVPMPLEGALETMLPSEPQTPNDYPALAERTPFVLRQLRNAEAAKAAVLTSQSTLWPTVSGDYSLGYSGASSSHLDRDSSVGVTVSIPLFAGGQHVQGALESSAEYRAAVETARSERDARIATLSDRWTAFRDAWELVAVRRSFLEAARTRSEIVRAQYTSGLVSFQDFDIAEQEVADAERSYVQSLADVLIREADWTAAQGGTLEEVVNAR